jgi:hypothetical protein
MYIVHFGVGVLKVVLGIDLCLQYIWNTYLDWIQFPEGSLYLVFKVVLERVLGMGRTCLD